MQSYSLSQSLAVNGALKQSGSLGVGGRVFGRPGGQGQGGSIGIAFAAGGDIIERENAIASFVDLNAAPLVCVETIDFRDHSSVSLGQAGLDVIGGWVASDIPGAGDRFRGDGAIGSGIRATPQIRADRGVPSSATVVVVAFLVQCQVVHALAAVDAANCLGCASLFAEIERISSVEH